MHKERDLVDRLRIASPCPMNWESMTGDERARFCQQCKLHVYNISEMTRGQAEALILKTEGRFCARLYRRADGTVLTKDCPVGLRAIRRRVSRVAGATLTAIFSFCMSATGQSAAQEDKSCAGGGKVKIKREQIVQSQDKRSMLMGVVKDVNGAVVAGTSIKLVNRANRQKIEGVTNDEGLFKFFSVEAGSYQLEVNAAGFQALELDDIIVENNEVVSIDVTLTIDQGITVIVGIVSDDSPIDYSGGNKTTFSPNKITRLPF